MFNLWVCQIFGHPSRWPWVKVTKLPKQDRFYIVPTIVRTAYSIATKLDSYIPLVMLSTWLNFLSILSETFLTIFYVKCQMRFFFNQTFYLPCLRNDWSNWCETKRHWVNWMLRWLGYIWPWPSTLIFDLEFTRSDCISGMGGPIVMERKGRESPGCPDVKHKGNEFTGPWPLTLNFQGQMASREWEARLSLNERDGSR